MSDDDNGVGRVLRPANFEVNKFRRSDVQQTRETASPDQFGQQYNNDYDHSKWSGESPQSTRRDHSRSDVDLSQRALHHTLGTGHSQASPGDHYHDGTNSKKLGPLEMDPVNLGQTRAVWTIPTSPTVADLVTLLAKFVNFRQV